MITPSRFPSLIPTLFDGSSDRKPVRLDFTGLHPDDNELCCLVRNYYGEWLGYYGLPPQMIGVPFWAVTLLGGLTNAGDSEEATTSLGDQRYNRAFLVENVGPHDPDWYRPPPEDSIDDVARTLDIDLVPPGVDPASLTSQALADYKAKLSLIEAVGTLGSPIGVRDEVLYARRLAFEADEQARVQSLINEKRKRYAKQGESLARMYALERKRSRG